MRIRMKRYSLIAYVIFLSCACLVLWMILFISSDDVVSPFGKIELTQVDRVKLDYGNKHFLKPGVVKEFDREDTGSLPDKAKKESVLIPDSAVLRNMSWQDLSDMYHRYLSFNQIQCSDVLRVGRVTDGGWDVCVDRQFAPHGSCVVYSFGVGDDFSFDDAVVSHFGCKVYSFDPSISLRSNQRSNKAFFYQQGIADSDRTLPNGWQMSKFESIRAGLKHLKTKISIVKMDIEEWEWEVLPDILASEHLATVNQLLMELHQCEGCAVYNPEQEDKEPSRDRYIHMLELLHGLYKLNFRIFHHHSNSACNYVSKFTMAQRSACVEVGFVRVL